MSTTNETRSIFWQGTEHVALYIMPRTVNGVEGCFVEVIYYKSVSERESQQREFSIHSATLSTPGGRLRARQANYS